jgi:acyl-coenzyme A synthetase/AMP-(fatty) acid ligase
VFLRHIYDHARNDPQKLAVVTSGVETSYLRFAQLIDHMRDVLRAMELPSDGVVAEIADNLLHRWVFLLALRSLGFTTVSGASWATLRGLGLSNLKAVVCLAEDEATRDAIAESGEGVRVIAIDRHRIEQVPADRSLSPLGTDRFGDHIAYTSGTTGSHKKVLFREGFVEAYVDRDARGIAARVFDPQVVSHASNFGPWTIMGLRTPLCAWYVGGTTIFEQRVSGADHFFDYPVNFTVLLPPMIQPLAQRFPDREPGPLPLRIITGGGFTAVDVALEAVRQLNGELYVNYGGTEFMVAFERRVANAEDVIWLDPTSPGDMQIVDEDDRPVAIGKEGIIRVRLLSSDPDGYLDDPETTAQHFRDGWFYPGDMAVQRADGRVRILGRIANVLNIGAQKIAVEPIEERARKFLDVANLCIFARQADDGQEEMMVVVEGDQLPAEARRAAIAAELPRNITRTYFVLVESFPRGDNGMMKVNRRALLKMAGWPSSDQPTAVSAQSPLALPT